jgi:dTDP-glucose 4,6-dehydratase
VDRSINDSWPFVRSNILGTHTLLEAARVQWIAKGHDGAKASRLFLQVSTDEVYGALAKEGRFTEDSPLMPGNPYAASKASADLLALSYNHTFELPVIVTRSSNNYGPFQFTEKLIPLMITKALAGNQLPVYGDGRNVRDWLHVEDNCEAIECVIHKGAAGQIYNIGGAAEIQNIEVVELILELLHKPKSLVSFVEDRLGHDWRYAIDGTRVCGLGWKPRHDFEEGLKQTVEWYANQTGQQSNNSPTCGAGFATEQNQFAELTSG